MIKNLLQGQSLVKKNIFLYSLTGVAATNVATFSDVIARSDFRDEAISNSLIYYEATLLRFAGGDSRRYDNKKYRKCHFVSVSHKSTNSSTSPIFLS